MKNFLTSWGVSCGRVGSDAVSACMVVTKVSKERIASTFMVDLNDVTAQITIDIGLSCHLIF
jgi:hypothetical protein